jgi:hypothetical protein
MNNPNDVQKQWAIVSGKVKRNLPCGTTSHAKLGKATALISK